MKISVTGPSNCVASTPHTDKLRSHTPEVSKSFGTGGSVLLPVWRPTLSELFEGDRAALVLIDGFEGLGSELSFLNLAPAELSRGLRQ